jgi:hypothetical protein
MWPVSTSRQRSHLVPRVQVVTGLGVLTEGERLFNRSPPPPLPHPTAALFISFPRGQKEKLASSLESLMRLSLNHE